MSTPMIADFQYGRASREREVARTMAEYNLVCPPVVETTQSPAGVHHRRRTDRSYPRDGSAPNIQLTPGN